MNKRILIAGIFVLLAAVGFGQTTIEAKRVKATDSLFINGKWIKYVITDTSLSITTDRDVVSADAIKNYVLNRLAYTIKRGDTAAMLQGYARVQRVLDSLTAVQSRIQTKLTKSDADTYYPAIQRLLDSMTAVQSRVQTKLALIDTSSMLNGYQRSGNPVTAAAQPNITSLGNLTGLTVSGQIASGPISSTDTITAVMAKTSYVRFGVPNPLLTLGTPFAFTGNGHTQVTQFFGGGGIGYEGAWVMVDRNSFLSDYRKAGVFSVRLGHRNSTRQTYIGDMHFTSVDNGVSTDHTFFTYEPRNGAQIFPASHIDSSYVPGIDKMLWVNGAMRVFDTLTSDKSVNTPVLKLSNYSRVYSSGTGAISEFGTDGHLWYINGAYRGIFTGSGHLLINSLTDDGSGAKLQVIGTVNATSFVTVPSDARKKNILKRWKSKDGIDIIKYKLKSDTTKQTHYGYEAQQVLRVLPKAVSILKDSTMIDGITYGVDEQMVTVYKMMMLSQRISDLERQSQTKTVRNSVKNNNTTIKKK